MTLIASFRPTAMRAFTMTTLALCLGACAGNPAPVAEDPAQRSIGGDRDAHGCLPAAGYTWCARAQQCVRPWELAKEAGFENTAEGFARYCDATPTPPAG